MKTSDPIDLYARPPRVGNALALMIVVLVMAYASSRYAVFGLGYSAEKHLLVLLDLGREGSVSSIYSGLILAAAGALLALTGAAERGRGASSQPWTILAGVFFFLACDETFALHEGLIKPVRALLQTSGYLRFAWVIPYSVLTAFLGAVYTPFLLRLPARTRKRFVLSGLIFVLGAVGMEMLGGKIEEVRGRESLLFAAEVLIEETLEMSGVSLFIVAILDYLRLEHPGLAVRLMVALSSGASQAKIKT